MSASTFKITPNNGLKSIFINLPVFKLVVGVFVGIVNLFLRHFSQTTSLENENKERKKGLRSSCKLSRGFSPPYFEQ